MTQLFITSVQYFQHGNGRTGAIQYNAHIASTLLLIGLAVAASVAPLLTFAALWQVKEWRIDRLREHLRNDGIVRQLFGIARPGIILVFACVDLVTRNAALPALTLGTLAGLGVIQSVLRRQPHPLWTQKAIVLVASDIILTLAAAAALQSSGAYPMMLAMLPILQPVFLGISWLLWKPVDHALKTRIMEKARSRMALYPEMTVVGITGSVGKTTTKELLAHIMRARKPLVTPAYVNSEMGVSQWLLREISPSPLNGAPSLLIAELGAYRRGEIATLCSILRPSLGVITFIGKQHVALFGSEQALCDAKGELFEALPAATGRAFLNTDCALCENVRAKAPCPVVTAGTGGHADIQAFDIEETPEGIRFRTGETAFAVPIHGTHNTVNVLMAIAVARHLGMTDPTIASALRSFTPPSNTFNVRTIKSVTVLDDTHNASPASFKAAIAWARNHPAAEKTLLTSGLIELGEEQDAIHTELGALAAPVFARVLFAGKRAARHFEQGFGKPVELLTRETPAVSPHSLLACVGRISGTTIERLIP